MTKIIKSNGTIKLVSQFRNDAGQIRSTHYECMKTENLSILFQNESNFLLNLVNIRGSHRGKTKSWKHISKHFTDKTAISNVNCRIHIQKNSYNN
jgi:hypothetical protein